ncbi:hypothetical protein [Streptomyces sp. NPDC001948]
MPAGAKFETFAQLDRVLGLDLVRDVGQLHRPEGPTALRIRWGAPLDEAAVAGPALGFDMEAEKVVLLAEPLARRRRLPAWVR